MALGKKLVSYALLCLVLYAFIFFLVGTYSNKPEPDKEVAGKVISVRGGSHTEYLLDDGAGYRFAGYNRGSLEAGDSVHRYVMAETEFYKKDTAGVWREILFDEKDPKGWHFKPPHKKRVQ